MYLKRQYDHRDPKRPRCVGVQVLNASTHWKVSTRLVQKALGEGWMSIGDGKITLKGSDRALRYVIERGPGYYCCHCGAALNDETSGRAHVSGKHDDAVSPDAENPAGYEQIHYYDCKLEA